MKLLILDGNSILNRAFYALGNLTAADGLHTGGIYGFLVTFLKTLKTEAPEYVAVAFDLPAPTFRHRAYADYKATRHKMPEELAEQLPVLKEVLSAMQVPILELSGYEADDIIGTVARLCEENGTDCRILTGDRDDLQLISEKTRVLLTTTRGGKTETVLYDTDAVFEKYGVSPAALIEVKGLMGDSSDNIPGVRGIGEKTALSLIQKYETIEGVYAHIDEIRGAQNTKLSEGRDMAFLSRELGTICREVPLAISVSDLAVKPYLEKELAALFRRLGFRALLSELGLPEEEEAPAFSAECAAYDGSLETASRIFFVHAQDSYYMTAGACVFALSEEEALPLLENENIEKVGHGIKETAVALLKKGRTLSGLFGDTEIAAYLLDPSAAAYPLSELCRTYLGQNPESPSSEAALLPSLFSALLSKMEEREQTALFFDLEMPTALALAKMEHAGVLADGEMLGALSASLSESIQGLETAIYAAAGEVFNMQSPRQLGTVLFEKLGLPPSKKTKPG